MSERHLAYLALLEGVGTELERLAGLARQKTEAVRRNDLLALDDTIRQEQAISLSLRGQEQKRQVLVNELGLGDVPLSKLAGRYPPELRARAKGTSEAVQHSYRMYQTAADAARRTLEHGLHEIERVIAAEGGTSARGAGYVPPDVEPPEKMKTDFHA